MAFCKNCGTDLQGAKFCANCGTAADDQLIQERRSALSADASMRQASIDECKKMIQYFDQKTATCKEYDRVTQSVALGRSHLHNLLLFFIIPWAAFGVFLLAKSGDLSVSSKITYFQGVLLWVGFVSLVFLLPPGLLTWWYAALNKRSKRKFGELLLQQSLLANEIVEHYNAYGYCHVGLEYTRVEILRNLLDKLELGRCKTIADAINITLDDAYKRDMQLQGEAILAAANRAADAAEEAATAAKASLLYDVMDHL